MSTVSSTQQSLTRIRVKCLPIKCDLHFRSRDENLDAKDVSTYLCNLFNIVPLKAIMVSYQVKHNEILQQIYTKYVFVDFYWNSNESNRFIIENKALLLQGQTILINISQNVTWEISLQDKSINVMKDSSSSVLMYFICKNENVPEDDEEYNNLIATIKTNDPFDAMEEPPSMGYRDSYEYSFERITKNDNEVKFIKEKREMEEEEKREREEKIAMEEEIEREERYETQLERFKDMDRR